MRFLLKMIKKGEIGKPISHAKMGKPILRYAERDFFRIVTIKCSKFFIYQKMHFQCQKMPLKIKKCINIRILHIGIAKIIHLYQNITKHKMHLRCQNIP